MLDVVRDDLVVDPLVARLLLGEPDSRQLRLGEDRGRKHRVVRSAAASRSNMSSIAIRAWYWAIGVNW